MERYFKHIITFIFCFFQVFSLFSQESGKFVLVIDPGHGGKDHGAPGAKSKEKNINLDVALLFGDMVKRNHSDVKVIYTRSTDKFLALEARSAIANKEKADLFVSIHANASESKRPYGAETYTLGLARTEANLEVAKRENSVILLEDNYDRKYEGFNPNSSESYIIFEYIQNKYVDQSISFASNIQKEFKTNSRRTDRGVRQAGFLVLRETSMPSVLVELGFISNPEEERYMISNAGQKSLAMSLYNAFVRYKNGHDKKMGITVKNNQDVNTPINVSNEDNMTIASNASSDGTIYKIQILTSGTKLSSKSKKLKGYDAEFYIADGMYKYTYGNSTNLKEINKILREISKDFKDAFVIQFKDGVRIK